MQRSGVLPGSLQEVCVTASQGRWEGYWPLEVAKEGALGWRKAENDPV